MQHLIASNVIIPKLGTYAFEVFIFVDAHCALAGVVAYQLYNVVITGALIAGLGRIQTRTVKQMDLSQFRAQTCQLAKQLKISCERDAGEIHPEILRKALAVLIAVQGRIDIVE